MKPIQYFANALLAAPFFLPSLATAEAGFTLAVNGTVIAGDKKPPAFVRTAKDIIAKADMTVTYEGLNIHPELILNIAPSGAGFRVTSQTNYPGFITRGELLLLNTRNQIVQTLPLGPNQSHIIPAASAPNLRVVHRVYGAAGHYDETAAIALNDPNARQATAARRGIAISGGGVLIEADNIHPNAVLHVGTTRIEPTGEHVSLHRIIPTGKHALTVRIDGPGGGELVEIVEIPRSEWFRTGVLDLTLGRRSVASGTGSETYSEGRAALFMDGQFANGWRVTAQADTGHGPLRSMVRRLQEKDPRAYARRVNPADLFQTYGDDSSLTDATPSNGRLFVHAQRGGTDLLWGNYTVSFGNSALLRNDRNLYGLRLRHSFGGTSERPRSTLTAYASQPDQLPHRDILRATGGSFYFLKHEDITSASDVISIELRDPDTGYVASCIELERGRDYEINYIQGRIALARPLALTIKEQDTLFEQELDPYLVAQYEYSPKTGDLDGLSYGARAEHWLQDTLRIGLTGHADRNNIADRTSIGADMLWQPTENSSFRFEIARIDGPDISESSSSDGGLSLVDAALTPGENVQKTRLEADIDFNDLGINTQGNAHFYHETHETRGLGTSSDDQTRWGVALKAQLASNVRFGLSYDARDPATSPAEHNGTATLAYDMSDAWGVEIGVRHKRKDGGNRTDVALRSQYEASEQLRYFGYVQHTLTRQNLPDADRIGAGLAWQASERLTLEGEASTGSGGPAGRLRLEYKGEAENSSYLSYDLTQATGSDARKGTLAIGAERSVSNHLQIFGETRYDLVGQAPARSNVVGLRLSPTDATSFSASFDHGIIAQDNKPDTERTAFSLGIRHTTEAVTASGRIEWRMDKADTTEKESLALNLDGAWQIDQAQRVFASARAVWNTGDNSNREHFSDVTLGYALRPVHNDRLNILAQYRYVNDTGTRDRNSAEQDAIRQESHLMRVAATYELTPKWDVSTSLAARYGRSASGNTAPLERSDAVLATLGVQYHLAHAWDASLELRHLSLPHANAQSLGAVATVYRQVGEHTKVGVGYNFGDFSDDLSDFSQNDRGIFVNLVASF